MTAPPTHREFDPFEPAFLADPYPLLAELREQSAVRYVRQPNGIEAFLILRHEEGRRVLTDKRFSANPEYGREALERAGYLMPGSRSGLSEVSLLTTDPPTHTRLRRLLSRSFDGGVFADLPRIVQAKAAEQIGYLAERATGDLVTEFAHPVTLHTLCALLGIDAGATDQFTTWISRVLTPRHRPDAGAIRAAADREIRGFLAELVRSKMEGGDDITARLVHEWRRTPGVVTETELSNLLYELILAGYLTTAGLIVNGLLALHRHPEQLALFRRDQRLRAAAVEEMMRFDGPAFRGSLRFACQDAEIDGVAVPAGSLVSVVFAAANRDWRAYPEPDRLDFQRTAPPAHLGFSHGIHLCWGAPIARVETELALAALTEAFPDLHLTNESELEWTAIGNSRSPHCVQVRFQ
jgi:cytochrome P450